MKSITIAAILLSSILAFLLTCNKPTDFGAKVETVNSYDSMMLESETLLLKIDSMGAMLDSIIKVQNAPKPSNKVIIIPPDRPYEY